MNTIAGGNTASGSFIGGGDEVLIGIGSAFSAIGAGSSNSISGTGGLYSAFIGAGNSNAIGSGGSIDAEGAFIGAGSANKIGSTASAPYAFIGAGYQNTSNADNTFIGSGQANSVSGGYGVIGGGEKNIVSATYGAVAGGYDNSAIGYESTVAGGAINTASSTQAFVAGGTSNVAAGADSFAAGYHANAAYTGSFVWSDTSSSAATKATAAYQFLARAAGGVMFFSNSAMTAGVSLAAGGGSWSNLSDRNLKTGIALLDNDSILDRVAMLPITEWSYISEPGVRHVGPMAQDFYAAFGVGEDNRHITTIDEDGIALAAIQALHREN
ncbi:MAG: tail fiber domain-containing protein, partial [Candidatus Eremiobacteraeota bacterium]|nr:tail fiber domain-containing protein [Candidatus Eremiobacteraeota bacterium]